jgi:hypothetical protein
MHRSQLPASRYYEEGDIDSPGRVERGAKFHAGSIQGMYRVCWFRSVLLSPGNELQ